MKCPHPKQAMGPCGDKASNRKFSFKFAEIENVGRKQYLIHSKV